MYESAKKKLQIKKYLETSGHAGPHSIKFWSGIILRKKLSYLINIYITALGVIFILLVSANLTTVKIVLSTFTMVD